MGMDKPFVKRALATPGHVLNILNIKSRCYTKIADLNAEVIKSDEPIRFEDLDKSAFKPAHIMEKWADKFGCAWFRFTGKVPSMAKGSHVVLRIKLQGEGLIFNEDGIVLQGITQVLSKGDIFHSLIGKQVVDVADCSTGNEEIKLYVDAGFNGKLRFENLVARLRRCDISICNDAVNQYYYDYIDLYFTMLKLDKSNPRVAEIDSALKASYKTFKKQGATAAREVLKPQFDKPVFEKQTEYYCIGHAHIDLAWLWPLRETKRKVARTFANQLRNIKRYDDFIFAESQPQMWTWLKEGYPDLYERAKQAVKDGRIELQGKMWVESDTNLTSGESWIRQSLYGDKFWKQEFGQDLRLCWLPDVFGFPATLPQVLKGCGMDYFMTIKLISNTVNQFPYKTFNWVGLDGTTLLAHMEPLGDYNAGASPLAIFKGNARNTEKEIIPKALLIYGDGDGGGGPGEGHIEYIKRHKKLFNCKVSKSINLFEDLEPYRQVMPTHKGELYYERHQGCYTSQARSKKFNRKIENLLHKVEWLGAVAKLSGAKYDFDEMEKIWKEVLLYQFHDILPGSSIKRVYDESLERYQALTNRLEEIEKSILLNGKEDGKLCAINPIGFERKEWIKRGDNWYNLSLAPYSVAKLPAPAETDASSLSFDDYTMQNSKVRVVFGNNGEITSLYDKEGDKEIVGKYFNKFTIYSDPFMYYNAWDINIDYINMKKWDMKLVGVRTYIDGVRVVREQTFKYDKSTLVQKISLTVDDNMVTFDTTVDWDERFKMLRADFIPAFFADEVNCDIQFGTFNRTTKQENKVDWAQFEICAHKYVNIDGADYGFALINDCKYGHRAKDGFLSLCLLRSPEFPDPTCDICTHTFSYAILPHKQPLAQSDVAARAYAFNNPVEIAESNVVADTFVKQSNDGVIVETVKPAESGEGTLLRVYECKGKACEVALTPSVSYDKAYESDMLENIKGETDLAKLTFRPWEIKTIILK